MKFGLTDEQLSFLRLNVVKPLEKKGALVWCYGSRARGDHAPYSDIDLMVEGSADLDSEISQIKEFLQKSNFPFKVDLVRLSDFSETYRPGFEKDKIKLS